MDNLQGRILVVDSPNRTVVGTVIRQNCNSLLLSSNVLPEMYWLLVGDITYQDAENGYLEVARVYQFGKEG